MSLELSIDEPGVTGVGRVTETLRAAGFRVQRSFDLRSVLEATLPDCGCPHHGTAACDCQYAVLLVYAEHGTPTTLVVHGRDGRFWLLFAEHPTYRPNPMLQQELLSVLAPILKTAVMDGSVPSSPDNHFVQCNHPCEEVS
jgi:hypothetical protein